jgi:hypothetical protein
VSKPVAEWGEPDLIEMLGSTQRASNLELRGPEILAERRRNEIARDVTAMANAEGGVVVYGVQTDANGVAQEIAGVPPVITRDWIEQTIGLEVEPPLEGIAIRQISLADGANVFTLEVPKSTTLAPHQAKGLFRYFRRYNAQSMAMLDHEIRDMMRRAASTFDIQISYDLAARGRNIGAGSEVRWAQLQLSMKSQTFPARFPYLHIISTNARIIASETTGPLSFHHTKLGAENRFDTGAETLFHTDVAYPVCRLQVDVVRQGGGPFLLNTVPVRDSEVAVTYRVGADRSRASLADLKIPGGEIADYLTLP